MEGKYRTTNLRDVEKLPGEKYAWLDYLAENPTEGPYDWAPYAWDNTTDHREFAQAVVLQKHANTVARYYHMKSNYTCLSELLEALLPDEAHLRSPRELMHVFSALLMFEAKPSAAKELISEDEPLKSLMLKLLDSYEKTEKQMNQNKKRSRKSPQGQRKASRGARKLKI